jgi:hypothetical protein
MTPYRSWLTARAKRAGGTLLVPVALAVVLIYGPSTSSAGEARESSGTPSVPGPKTIRHGQAQGLLPIARTGKALTPTSMSAILTGEINARGRATRYKFQYGLTRPYAHTGEVGERELVGRVTDEVAEGIRQLKPGATYHYRIIAFNKYGFTTGKDRTFRAVQRAPRAAGLTKSLGSLRE